MSALLSLPYGVKILRMKWKLFFIFVESYVSIMLSLDVLRGQIQSMGAVKVPTAWKTDYFLLRFELKQELTIPAWTIGNNDTVHSVVLIQQNCNNYFFGSFFSQTWKWSEVIGNCRKCSEVTAFSVINDLCRRGTLGICGVAVLRILLCGVAVKKSPACGVAVISSLTVCDICILKSTVFGEKILSAVFPFP